jgi:hypothetical protein
MANNYSWDLTRFVTYMLPSFLRKTKQISWLKALLAPMDRLNSELVTFATDTRYALNFTGQVISLERLLNDTFDNSLRRIYISDGNRQEKFVALTGSNNPPTPEQVIFRSEASSFTGENFAVYSQSDSNQVYDFQVNVPTGLSYNAGQLNALMNKYKKAGKKYNIATF